MQLLGNFHPYKAPAIGEREQGEVKSRRGQATCAAYGLVQVDVGGAITQGRALALCPNLRP